MRSHPSCWNKTLTKLGFKRKRRKKTRRPDFMSRRSMFEPLEARQMLAASSVFSDADHTITHDFDTPVEGAVENATSTWLAVSDNNGPGFRFQKDGLFHFDLSQFGQDVTNVTVTLYPVDNGTEEPSLVADQAAYFLPYAYDDTNDQLKWEENWTEATQWDDILDRSDGVPLQLIDGSTTWTVEGSPDNYDPIVLDVTAEVRRKLRQGDLDFDGKRDLSDAGDDVAAFELLLKDPTQFQADYGFSVTDQQVLDRADMDGSGVVDEDDFDAFLAVHGTLRGDINFDGEFSRQDERDFGDLDPETTYRNGNVVDIGEDVIDSEDEDFIDEWTGETGPSVIADTLTLRVYATEYDATGTEFVYYATHESTANPTDKPTLTVEEQTFVVNSLEDLADLNPGDGVVDASTDTGHQVTLRAALQEAASLGAENSVISFDPSLVGGTIVLSQGELLIDSNVSIVGLGAEDLTVDANASISDERRVFSVASGASATISALTITGGYVSGSGVSGSGGGIHSAGNLVLDTVVIEENTAEADGGGLFLESGSHEVFDSTFNNNTATLGGGIYNKGNLTLHEIVIEENTAESKGGGLYSVFGSVDLIDSTIDNNSADHGGGAWFSTGAGNPLINILGSTVSNNTAVTGSGGGVRFFSAPGANTATVAIVNSTFSGNNAGFEGGGMLLTAQGFEEDPLEIINSTITGNYATTYGGGISRNSGTYWTLKNSIVAGNMAGNEDDLGATLDNDSKYNIFGSTVSTTQAPDPSNIILGASEDPGLAPLADYGGPTQTHALLVGSDALDAGDNTLLPPATQYDQRGVGFPRRIDGTVDIGAYEAGAGSADILFVVDESGSMGQEHTWLETLAPQLDTALADLQITGNRYALVGFGGSPGFGEGDANSHVISLSATDDWGTAAEFSVAAHVDPNNPNSLQTGGNAEDGYAGIDHAFANLSFRAKAPLNVILVTDEERDELIETYDYTGMLDLLDRDDNDPEDDAILNVVVNANIEKTSNPDAVGLEASDVAFVPDGMGKFTSETGYSVIESTEPDADDTLEQYIELAWDTNGATWDLNTLRQGGLLAQSFTNAFVTIKAEEIANPGLLLQEDTRLVTTDEIQSGGTEFTVPSNPDALRIDFSALTFDDASGNPTDINDAFEIAILRKSDGAPAVATIDPDSDAVFNITQGFAPVWAEGVELLDTGGNLVLPGTQVTEGSVQIDISTLAAGAELILVARLLNNDDDDTTNVTIDFDPPGQEQGKFTINGAATANLPVGFGAPFGLGFHQSNLVDQQFDPDDLDDVTTHFDLDYTHTTYDETAGVLRTGFTLTKNDDEIIRGPLVAVITNLRWQDAPGILLDVVPLETDGVTFAGEHYYNLSHQAFSPIDLFLDNGEVVTGRELVFRVPSEHRFDFDLEIRGHLNDAPHFTTLPNVDPTSGRVEVPAGNTFTFDFNGHDPDDDDIYFKLVGTPPSGFAFVNPDPVDNTKSLDGIVAWDTTGAVLGSTHDITMEVVDEFGASTTEEFTIEITDVNNAPYFIAPAPDVDAYANTRYISPAHAFDPDYDTPLTFTVTSTAIPGLDGDDLAIDPVTGEITWTPKPAQIGQTFTVDLQVEDPGSLTDDLTFNITVHPDPLNHDPIIISEPNEQHFLPEPPPDSQDDVSPLSIDLILDEGQSITIPDVSIDLAETSNKADIVFIVDESGSMEDEHVWLQGSLADTFATELSMNYGFGDIQFALVGFGGPNGGVPHPIDLHDSDSDGTPDKPFGNKDEFATAALGLVTDGDDEDGYQGIDYALTNLDVPLDGFRDDAAVVFVLITDEHRDNPDPLHDFESISTDLLRDTDTSADDVILNLVIRGDLYADDTIDDIGDFGSFTKVEGDWAVEPLALMLTPDVGTESSVAFVEASSTAQVDDYAIDTSVIVSPGDGLVDEKAFVIFDYDSVTDFKFAGLDTLNDEWIIGSRDALGWNYFVQEAAGEDLLPNERYRISIETGNPFLEPSLLKLFESGSLVASHDFGVDLTDREFGFGTRGVSAEFGFFRLSVPSIGYQQQPLGPQFKLYETFHSNPDPALGIDSEHHAFYANGSGGLEEYSGINGQYFQVFQGLYTAYRDYVLLAWGTDGAVWSLNHLRQDDELLEQSFSKAFSQVIGQQLQNSVEVQLQIEDPDLGFSYVETTVGESSTRTFDVTFTGDGRAHSFDLNFLNQFEDELGTIPVAVNAAYTYDLNAIDPDGDKPLTFDWTGGAAQNGATLDDGVITWNPTDEGTFSFDVTVYDGRGGSDRQMWDVEVEIDDGGNTAPEITATTPVDTNVRRSWEFQVVAEDEDDDQLRYYLIPDPATEDPPPAGMTVDRNTGVVSWTPGLGQDATHEFWVLVSDGRGGEATHQYSVDVGPQAAANQLPVFGTNSLTETPVGDVYVDQVLATDPDGDPITYSPAAAPEGMAIDPVTGAIRWEPDEDDLGVHTVIVRAHDGLGSNVFAYDLEVTPLNQLPVFLTDADLPGAVEGVPYETFIVAYDPFVPATGSIGTVTLSSTNLPAWLTLTELGDGYTAKLSGTPTSQGSPSFDIIADDGTVGGAGQTTKAFNLTVAAPTPNRSPEIENEPQSSVGVGQSFFYKPDISDPDNNPLSITLETDAPWMSIDNGVFTGAPRQQDVGQTFTITVTVDDNQGAGNSIISDEFAITVPGIPVVDDPPRIVEMPIPVAKVGMEYSLPLEAVDPEEKNVTWQAFDKPDQRMALHPETGVLTWMPGEEFVGQTVTVRIRATDPALNYAEAVLPIKVVSNALPELDSNPPRFIDPLPEELPIGDLQVYEGGTFRLDVFGMDPYGDKLYPVSGDAPAGMVFYRLSDTSFRLVWDVPIDQSNLSFTLNLIDEFDTAGTNPQTINIDVLDDNEAPTVSLATSQTAAVENEPILFTIAASDNAGIANLELVATRVSDQETFNIPVDANFQGIGSFEDGIYDVQVRATDSAGNSTDSNIVQIEVFDQSYVKLPTLAIDPLGNLPTVEYLDDEEVITLTEAVTVEFHVDNEDSLTNQDDISYKLELLSAVDGSLVSTLTTGTGEVLVLVDDDSAVINPLALPNGGYLLRLTAVNEFGVPVVKREYLEIDTGRNKLGNFAISFTDLEIPVVGLPISVTRSYDTTGSDTPGDFGYGWELGIADATLAVDYNDGSGPSDAIRDFTVGTRIVLTLPDGSVDMFQLELVPPPDALIVTYYLPVFTPVGNTTSELLLPQPTLAYLDGKIYQGGGGYRPLATPGGVDVQLEDGTRLKFNGTKLSEVVDREGNRTIFTGESIVNETTGRGLVIERNHPQGFITAVVDDENNRIEYFYDDAGNLQRVVNREDEETWFYYGENGAPGHFLTGIEDNQGIRVLSPEFYDDGRLKTLGTAGADVGFEYELQLTDLGVDPADVNGRVLERITDAFGVPTEIVRDSRGNVERRLQLVDDNGDTATNRYLVSFFRYQDDVQTHAGMPAEVTGLADALVFGLDFEGDPDEAGFVSTEWQSVSIVNADGLPTVQFDALGNPTYFEGYNSFGQPRFITDAAGVTTENDYDSSGNLTGTIVTGFDEAGNLVVLSKTTFGYQNGQLTSTKNARGDETSKFVYDGAGNLTSTEDAVGFIRSFTPDAFGRVTETSYEWDDTVDDGIDLAPGGPITVTTTTVYDDEGRVTSSTDAHGNVTETEYDAAGRVKRTVRKTFVGLDAQEEPIYDDFDEITENFYDVQGQLLEVRTRTQLESGQESWIVTRTAYDANGREIFRTDAFLEGDLTTPGTETVYDDLGRVVETIRYDVVTIDVIEDPDYDHLDDPLVKLGGAVATDNQLSSTKTYYDSQGRVQFTVDPAGLISEFVYDAAGRQEQSIQYLSGTLNTDTMVVDNIDDITTDKLITKFEYDKVGRQVLVTDALDRSTRSVYDDLGRVIKTIFHDGTQTETVYDDLGNRVAEIAQHDSLAPGLDKSTITTNYEYDDAGRLTAVILPPVQDPNAAPGVLVRPRYEYAYDIYGNQVAIHDNIIHDDGGSQNHNRTNARETSFAFDHLNRQVARTLPLGVAAGFDGSFQESMEYDLAGRLARSTDFEERVVDYIYDDLGRLTEKRFFEAGDPPNDEPGDATNYDEVVDYVFDGLGRQKQVKQDYNNDGVADRITDNLFDDFGRLERVTTPEGTIHYDYFADTGQLERTYTGADLPNARTVTEYTYDRLSRLETVTAVKQNGTAVGHVTTYEYDAVGNLSFVIVAADAAGSMVSQYTYDDLNRLELLEHYYDADNNRQFDGADRRLATFDYEVRADGRRTGVIEQTYDDSGVLAQTNTVAWVYDNANRLIAEYFDGEGTDHDFIDFYTHDLVGNRLKKQHDADPGFAGVSEPADLLNTTPDFANGTGDETIDYVYDDNDRLLRERINDDQTAGYDRTIVYEYGDGADLANDYAGDGTQQTRKAEFTGDNPNGTGTPDKETLYTYNNQGRLKTVEIDDNGDGAPDTTIDYEYNDSGIRVSETTDEGSGPIKTRYLIDANNHTGYSQALEVWEDLSDDGIRDPGELTGYVLGHDILAQWTDANGLLYLLYDGHGSTRGLVDALGEPLTGQVYAYDAYGNQLSGTGLTLTSATLAMHRYAGEWFDLLTGNYNNRRRIYNPATGRFGRLDPVFGNIFDPQSFHKYLFGHADPVQNIDPLGLFSVVGVSSASSIGSTLNSITAEVGQSTLSSLEQKRADLSNFSFQVAALASPLVLAVVGSFGDELFKSIGIAAEQVTEGALRTARLTRSGLAVVRRPGLIVRQLTDAAGNAVPLYGRAQRIGTTGHATSSLRLAKKLAISGKYEYITLNRSWRTSTGRIATSSRRPDVIAIARDGTVDAFEIQSATDISSRALLDRLEEGMNTLPVHRQGNAIVFDINDARLR